MTKIVKINKSKVIITKKIILVFNIHLDRNLQKALKNHQIR